MRVRSRLAVVPRRLPRQQRGQQRVADLLRAAADVIGDEGYDAATMSEIASRAGACIGSLYQFFPNKDALTEALRAQYCEELRTLWISLEDMRTLTVSAMVRRLIGEVITFLEERPALLSMLSSSCNQKDTTIRDLLRERLSRILPAATGHLSKTRSYCLATVILQVMKGMNELYAESRKPQRKIFVQEYEQLLTSYLRQGLVREQGLIGLASKAGSRSRLRGRTRVSASHTR